MVTEDYVSFEVAKLLKEKGFNEPCFAYYSEYIDNWKRLKIWKKSARTYDTVRNPGYILVSTIQMAMKWLREVHNIVIEITSVWIESFGYNYIARIVVEGESKKSLKHYNHHEEACEAAIKYSLENLI